MTETVFHQGTVVAVKGSIATVRLNDEADEQQCMGCSIAAVCNRSRTVEAHIQGAPDSLVGRQATLMAGSTLRRLATALYLGIPLAICLCALAIASYLGASQGLAGTCSLAAMALWYGALFALRHHISNKAEFRIVEIH